eukprot:9141778-Lingulodinium_polyedra.AAC.1
MASHSDAADSVGDLVPLHAGPPRIFSVKREAGYPKLWRLLFGTAAEDTHCRGRGHLGKLWE